MVSAWPELRSAKPAEPSAGVCDGKEALARCTSETSPNWRLIDHKSDASSASLAPFSLDSRPLRRDQADASGTAVARRIQWRLMNSIDLGQICPMLPLAPRERPTKISFALAHARQVKLCRTPQLI